MPAALAVHGGAGAPREDEYPIRQAAADRALEAGWARIGEGALEAVIAAVRHMEDEPALNSGIGACLNLDGEVEMDAAVMEGTTLRAGAVGAVRDVRHPVELARAVLEDGRHVLLVAGGASRFAREQGVEITEVATFVTERQLANWRRLVNPQPGDAEGDTVGAVAVDGDGRTAVAVSTGGVYGKLPGRVGDSPLVGCGFYADDAAGAVCGTGLGEGFMRLVLAHRMVFELAQGKPAQKVAEDAIALLEHRLDGRGGVIVVTHEGTIVAHRNTPYMAFASRTDG